MKMGGESLKIQAYPQHVESFHEIMYYLLEQVTGSVEV